jgi:hypothetical protein
MIRSQSKCCRAIFTVIGQHYSHDAHCSLTGPSSRSVVALSFGVPKHASINSGCIRRGACRLLQFGSDRTGACCKYGDRYKLAASTAVANAQFKYSEQVSDWRLVTAPSNGLRIRGRF